MCVCVCVRVCVCIKVSVAQQLVLWMDGRRKRCVNDFFGFVGRFTTILNL